MSERVGVEIGGTFTDLVWAGPDGSLRTGKVPSTPQAIHEAVLRVIGEAGVPLPSVDRITHGSTVATNALLTRRGAAAGIITTAGFRDVITIGRADRDRDIYNIRYRRPRPPIPRRLVREVPERIDAAGRVLEPLDLEKAWQEVAALIEEAVEGIAICFLHAYRNPVHEKALADLIRARAPEVAVSASHEVSPEFREYERTATTAVNAFVGPVVGRYVGQLDASLRADGYAGVLHIMQSNGGTMPADMASANAVRMMLSGPAAGVRAAVWFAERNGSPHLLIESFGLIPDSCGAGEFNGGLGLFRRFQVRDGGVSLSLYTDHFVIAPRGHHGGHDGRVGKLRVFRGNEVIELGATSRFALRPGDLVEIALPGGGGWGDPRCRDSDSVARDVADGLVTPDFASREYGWGVSCGTR